MAKGHHKTFLVGGIATHVYGLENAHAFASVDVVFLLHGRTRTWQDNVPWAHRIIELNASSESKRPLLAVTFDARNHGDRMISEINNKAWNDGNPTHGQDMYSIQFGTSQDVSFLITMLPLFLFPDGKTTFTNVLCAGVSLGGHETYLVLSHDERVQAGVAVIGCPDFRALMIPRATEAKIEERLPNAFLELVARLDPKLDIISKKDTLVLKGDDDILVPWEASEEFVSKLPKDKAEVVGYPGVGHAFPNEMLEKSAGWIVEWCAKH